MIYLYKLKLSTLPFPLDWINENGGHVNTQCSTIANMIVLSRNNEIRDTACFWTFNISTSVAQFWNLATLRISLMKRNKMLMVFGRTLSSHPVQRIQMTREVGSWRNAFGHKFVLFLFRTEFNLFLSPIFSIWHRRHNIKHKILMTKPSTEEELLLERPLLVCLIS